MFTLYLMRERDNLGDDIVQVRRSGDHYVVRYRDGETGEDRLCRNLSAQQAWSYLYNLFYGISVDTDPFFHFQISMVGFPSLVYAISDLEYGNAVWSHIMTLVSAFFQHTWIPRPAPPPREPSSGRAPAPAARNEHEVETPPLRSLPVSPPGSEGPHDSEWGGEESPTVGANYGSP